VFAVPGSVNSPQSRGTHLLLRDGARLVQSVDDILDELQCHVPATRPKAAPLPGPRWDDDASLIPPAPLLAALAPVEAPQMIIAPPPAPDLPPEEQAVLTHLSTQALIVDDIIEATALSPAQVNAALLMLELKGFAQRRPGNAYIRLQ
jgi:DNA processing protein